MRHEKGAKSRSLSFLKNTIPWAVSLTLIGYVASTQDMGSLANALKTAHYFPFVVLTLGFLVLNLLMDTAFFFMTFRLLEKVGNFGDMLRARAASYLLTVISLVLGFGGLAVYVNRRYGVPLRRGAGIMVNELLQELGSLGLLAMLIASWVPTSSLSPAGVKAVSLTFQVGAIGVGFWLLSFLVARGWRLLPQRFHWNTGLNVLVEMSLGQWLAFFSFKFIQNIVHGTFVALGILCFQIKAPVLLGIGFTQVVHLVRALPVAAFGIGIDQVTVPVLFGPWEPSHLPGQALAFSLVYTAVMVIGRGLLGVPFLKETLRDLRPLSPNDSSELAPSQEEPALS